jgi:hypothetical protein
MSDILTDYPSIPGQRDQLKGDLVRLRQDHEALKFDYECLNAAFFKLLERADALEKRLNDLQDENDAAKRLLTLGTDKVVQRSQILNDEIRKRGKGGFISRGEAQKILGDGKRLHPEISLRAMEKAAEIFPDLKMSRSGRNRIVLVWPTISKDEIKEASMRWGN